MTDKHIRVDLEANRRGLEPEMAEFSSFVKNHLPGKHSQKKHGTGGGGSSGQSSGKATAQAKKPKMWDDVQVTKKEKIGSSTKTGKVIGIKGDKVQVLFPSKGAGQSNDTVWVDASKTKPAEKKAPKKKVGAKGKATNPNIVKSLQNNPKGPNISANQAKKLKALNPNGIEDNTFKIPEKFGSKNPAKIKALMSTLPPGTKVVKVNAAASKQTKPTKKLKKNQKPSGTITKSDKTGGKFVSGSKSSTKKIDLSNAIEGPGVMDGNSSLTSSATLVKNSKIVGGSIAADKGRAALTTKEKIMVSGWTNGQYGVMRERVANATESGKELHHNDKALVSGIKKQPKVTGPLYRGIQTDGNYGPRMMQAFAEIGVGGEFSDLSPASYSRSSHAADSFGGTTTISKNIAPNKVKHVSSSGLMIKVKSKTARSVSHLSGHPGEQEAVALPGTRYKITKIVKNARLTLPALGPATNVNVKAAMYVEMEEI